MRLMTKTYYHATPFENLGSILANGILPGPDGRVYLTDDPQDAAKFVAIRFCRDILVVKVDLEEDLVEESYDHNEAFFKCKAYTYKGTIRDYDIDDLLRYQLDQ